MIDSLLGLVLLMMMSGWMASLVAVQSQLSAPARPLSLREQLDYLLAVKEKEASVSCDRLIESAKSTQNLEALQLLLASPQLLQRPDGESLKGYQASLMQDGKIAYTASVNGTWKADTAKLLPVYSGNRPVPQSFSFKAASSPPDWFYTPEDLSSDGAEMSLQTMVCS